MKNSQNRDFEAHQYPEEGSPTISKLWFMDIMPSVTLKTNMSPYNPMLALSGPQKNRKNAILALYGPIFDYVGTPSPGRGWDPGLIIVPWVTLS